MRAPKFTWVGALCVAGLVACNGPGSLNGNTQQQQDDDTQTPRGRDESPPDSGPPGGPQEEEIPDAGELTEDAGTLTEPRQVTVDLRADNNRDGVVSLDDPTEDQDEDVWSDKNGAIFLANLDDDESACPVARSGGGALSDTELARCFDAADEKVNGAADLEDMAVLKVAPWSQAPDDARGEITLSTPVGAYVRLFKRAGATYAPFDPSKDFFDEGELRRGIELRLEGKDIVRDRAVWDGLVTVTLKVSGPGVEGSDSVQLRVSPVMTFHHLSSTETAYVARISGDPESLAFNADLRDAVTDAGVPNPLQAMNVRDQWNQDYFETGYMSMPDSSGGQKVIRVAYRSANVYSPGSSTNPLRPAGKVVFTDLRGPDWAGIQEYDRSSPQEMDSLNSFGNTETIPPYSYRGVSYPLGRLFRGSIPQFYPNRKFSKMLEAQGQQPPVYVDTSWLLVGHVDETFSFLKANTPRGWIALVNDARLAKTMLEEQVSRGRGNLKMFAGQSWLDNFGGEYSAEATINEVLADTNVMGESAASAAEVDAQLAIVKNATGLTDAEIIHVPYLHWKVSGYSLAYQPGTVNMFVLNGKRVVVPRPFGPVVNGRDIFEVQLEEALAPYGYTVSWIDNWNLYHRLAGEVHCGTNAARSIPSAKWWETGR